jgi:hypothetical protein
MPLPPSSEHLNKRLEKFEPPGIPGDRATNSHKSFYGGDEDETGPIH